MKKTNYKKRSKKILSLLLTLGLIQSVLSGCGSETTGDVNTDQSENVKATSSDESQASDNEKITLRVGYFSVNEGTAELYVASELGYLEEELGENVNIELVPFANGPAANEAFLAGEIDFQNGIGDLPLLNGWRSGVDTILLAQTGGLGEHVGIMVSNDSGIESIEALKGKNVGVYVGTTFHKSALGILSDHGLSAGDVNFVNIDSTADGIAALESGELDAYYMPNTYYTDYAEENDIGYILEDSTAYPTFGYFVGTADFVSTYPEETKALLKALQRAADYINADKEAAAKLISDFLGTEFDSAYSVITYHNVEVELTDAAISNLYNAENFLNDAGAVETRLTEDEINAHIDYSYYESAVGDEN